MAVLTTSEAAAPAADAGLSALPPSSSATTAATPSASDTTPAHTRGHMLMACSAVTEAVAAIALNLAQQSFHVRPAATVLVRAALSLVLSALYVCARVCWRCYHAPPSVVEDAMPMPATAQKKPAKTPQPARPQKQHADEDALPLQKPQQRKGQDATTDNRAAGSGGDASPARGSVAFLLLVRGVLGTVTAFCMSCALARAPVGVVLTLFSTAPILVTCLAAVLLGEPFTRMHVTALVVNFSGAALVCQPATAAAAALHTRGAVSAALQAQQQQGSGGAVSGALFALAAALAAALGYTSVRALGARVHFMATGAVVSVVSVAASLPPVVFGGGVFAAGATPSRTGLLLAVVGGGVAFVGQGCINSGLQLARAGPCAVIRSLTIPLSLLLGNVVLGERVALGNVAGVALVLASVVASAAADGRLRAHARGK